MFGTKSRSIASILLATLMVQLAFPVLPTYANNTPYYIDATGGSDTNDGLTPGTAWQTLGHASLQTYLPGDSILLRCGDTWTDSLTLDDVGTAIEPITVSTYGSCDASTVATLANPLTEQIYIDPGADYINITNLTFLNGSGILNNSGSNIDIRQNRFENTTGVAITNSGSVSTIIEDNYFSLGSGSIGIRNQNDGFTTVSYNTFSGGDLALEVRNSYDATINNNTIFKPATYAITVVEDTTVPAGTMQNNVISSNEILTYNESYPVISMNDMNDAIGQLALLSSNNFINVYKAVLPLVEVMGSGASSVSYNKDDIGTLDLSATVFTAFGYKTGALIGSRANEARLLVNTGSTSANMACPGGGGCPTQYVTTTTPDTNIVFPLTVGAYSSRIILWRDTASFLTPANILHRPTGTFSVSNGTPPNGTPIDFTWSVVSTGTTISDVTFEGETNTGAFSYTVGNTGTVTLYPPEDANTMFFLYATNDIGTTTFSGEVIATNSPPVAVTGTGYGTEDDAFFTGQVLATDNSSGALTYTYETAVNPAHGSLSLAPDGTYEFYPAANFCGQTTFMFSARDEDLATSDPAIHTLVVACTNDTPVAIDDTLSATGGVTGTLDVVANDTDPDLAYESQIYTVSGITLPSQGTLIASGSVFEYTPDLAFMGVETFTYVTIDQSGAVSNTGTITVNVAPGMNIAPTVSSGSATLNEDDSVLGTFSGSDVNSDPLSYSATTLPTNGTLTIIGSDYSYIPNANFNGTDSFDFVANDGFLNSSGATITLTINSIMDAPVAVNDTINVEMNTVTNLDVMVNDTDPDEPYQVQTLTLTGISTPTNGTATIVGNEIQYTPNTLYLGADSIDYVIVDQDSNISNTGTVTISVTTSNQVPNADSGSYILTEDIPLTQTLSGSDPEGVPVTFVLDANTSNGTVVLSSTGEFTYTPDQDYSGIDSFSFHVSDGVFGSAVQIVSLTVDPINDNPFASGDIFIVNEDSSLDTTPLANDYDVDIGDTFVLNSVTAPISGTATITGGLITYTPNVNYCGTDTFEYTTIDLSGATSNVGSVTMMVTCINDTPTAATGSYTMTGNVITNSGSVLMGTLSGSDIDVGDILTYNIIQNVSSGVLILTGSNFSYEPAIDFTGSDMFTFSVTDTGGLTSSTVSVTITVLPNDFNSIPVAFNGGFSNAEDMPIYDTLSGSDAEGTPLIFVLDQDVVYGSLTISSTGALTYIPDANYNGTQIFTFYVSDGINNSISATGTITIGAVNDAPIVVNDVLTVNEDFSGSIDVAANDFDIEGDTISFGNFSNPTHGTIYALGTGTTILYYTPDANYCGIDSVSYNIQDTNLATSGTGVLNINVTCVNDAPTASGETVSTIEDTSIFIPVLGNDTDIENDTLSVTSLTQPSTGGTVQLVSTGVQFIPTPNYCTPSPVTFTYQARDTASALSNIATVTVSSITCVNDTPTSMNTSYTMTGNVVINPGTMLSGGTLTGYVATNNTLIQSLTASDVDGDTVTFSGVTFPTHGTGTLSSTGLLTYIPTPGYIGNDSLTFRVTDGALTSTVYTVTLIVQDPNPPVYTAPTSGPGGGGGGGSSMTNVYSSVAATPRTATGLTNQLLLANPRVKKSTTQTTPLLTSFDEFIAPIVEIVEDSQVDPMSSKDRAAEIRRTGQKMLHSLTRSLILESVEKAAILEESSSDLETVGETLESSRESRALEFIIRLMKRERQNIEKGVEALQYVMSI